MAPLSGMHKSANSITSLLGVVYHTAPNISYTLYLCPGPWGALRCRASVQGLACGGGAWQWGAVGGSDGGVNSVEQRQELKEADDVQLHPTCVSSLAWVRIMLFVVFARATVCAQARERGGGGTGGERKREGKKKGEVHQVRHITRTLIITNLFNNQPFRLSPYTATGHKKAKIGSCRLLWLASWQSHKRGNHEPNGHTPAAAQPAAGCVDTLRLVC